MPFLLHEDEHLLVVNKPAGMNTHAPAPYAGEGLYDWLKHREPRWAALAILHRLDKDTSGVIVFGKTAQANRSLTGQFTRRAVQKKYLLLSDRPPPRREFVVKSRLARIGECYASAAAGDPAETRFRATNLKFEISNLKLLAAEPVTGRTHQIRVHAAENGFPILGDTLYGGSRFARVCLHAAEITLRHPADHREITFTAPVDFNADPGMALRNALIDPEETNAVRLIHGASDGWPGWYVDRLGKCLLSQGEQALGQKQRRFLERSCDSGIAGRGLPPEHGASLRAAQRLTESLTATIPALPLSARTESSRSNSAAPVRSIYHKILRRRIGASAADASPHRVLGKDVPDCFVVRENGLAFELSFSEGYSVGLFLDQRDNRRRWLINHIAAGFPLLIPGSRSVPEVLNAFAYTCGFSVCAAKAGARVTSLDLSKKYLEWGQRNFILNQLDPAAHEFIFGDAFDWLRRLAKKQHPFDAVILDPPTFSQSKASGVFRVEKDFGRLVCASLPLLRPGGILFVSSNAAGWSPEDFLGAVAAAIQSGKRRIIQQHYAPQPPDFPISRREPAYLKTAWLRVN